MKPLVLNNETLIPLGVLSILAGAMFWVTSIYYQGVANAKEIVEVKSTQDSSAERIDKMTQTLIEVKTELALFHKQYREDQRKK